MTRTERVAGWEPTARVVVGGLSLVVSVTVGCIGVIALSLVNDMSSMKVLLTALMAVSVAYGPGMGYLGYRLALRSWRLWAMWAAAAVIAPVIVVQVAVHAL